MEIKKENEIMSKIHKKRDGTIHKKSERKINGRQVSTRVKGGVKSAGTAAEKSVTDNVEGGEEIDNALVTTAVLSRPVVDSAKKTTEYAGRIRKQIKLNNQVKEKSNNRIRKQVKKRGVNTAKKTAKKAAKETAKKTTKKVSKEVTKEVVKESAKIATKVGTTVAGSAAGPEGTLIGIAAGEAVGEAIEIKLYKFEKANRKFKYFMDKLNSQDKQKDSVFKLVGDLIKMKVAFMARRMVRYAIPLVLSNLVIISITAGLVFAIIAVLYNSPLAIFLPPLSSGETLQSVTSSYVTDFYTDINALVTAHEGADNGRIVYVDYEGMNSVPSNYYDIMCVYMITYGYQSTAIEMTDANKQNLKQVFDDMCSYTTVVTTETVQAGEQEVTVNYLDVRVTLKSHTDMESIYQFDAQKISLLESMMSNYRASGGGITMTDSRSSLSADEITAITTGITDVTRRNVVSFALSKVGFPYSQSKRDSGNFYDCSSLAFYSWKSAGINIAYGDSNSAAAEAQFCDSNNKTVTADNLKPGDLIFYSYTPNGRYKNISHVGIYIGNGKMVEAVDEATGVVMCDYHDANMVLIGRPNKR